MLTLLTRSIFFDGTRPSDTSTILNLTMGCEMRAERHRDEFFEFLPLIGMERDHPPMRVVYGPKYHRAVAFAEAYAPHNRDKIIATYAPGRVTARSMIR